jgi:cytosine/adenosine deaminase-related metal-dependent hydrolase
MSARRRHHRLVRKVRQRARRALELGAAGLALIAACRQTRPLAETADPVTPAGESAGGETVRPSPSGRGGARAEDAAEWQAQGPEAGGEVGAGGRETGGGPPRAPGAGTTDGAEHGAVGQSGGDAHESAGGPGRVNAPFDVVSCGALADEGDCRLSGEGDELLVRGDVLTPGAVLEGGAVRLDANGTILCVGCACDGAGARVLTCPGAVVSPAFINPHDHVAYAEEAPRAPTAERYEHRHDWRLGLEGHTKIAYEGGAPAVVRAAHELRMLLSGVTALAGGAGHEGLVRNPDLSGLNEGLPAAPADSETFPLDDADGRLIESGCRYGADHARSSDVERTSAFLAHLGEGINAAAQNELDCALTQDFGLIGPTTAVVHAVATRADRAAALGARHATVVWSPRSNLVLYGNTAPVPLLLRSGVEVALGTDWLLTGSMNLLRELDCARRVSATYFDGALDDFALWAMVTHAAARAVGAGNALGRLEPGYLGDIAVIARHGREPFTTAVAPNLEDFELVLRGGRALYGRESVVAALQPGACEPLDVCGAAQSACVADSGFSLAELEAAAEATYPLFTCDAPPNEPSCVAMRPLEYADASADGDRDGDGVADGDDVCPSVFDPVRPLDDGAQADTDSDGVGDACDPCPLDPSPDCVDARSGDRDADGVPDGADACPDTPDPDQADADRDGHGDACDYCAEPNPGFFPCTLAIAALRDRLGPSRPPRLARVSIADAIVTALRPDSGNARGFYVEDRAAPLSGLFVYTGSSSPSVALGDRVTVEGRLDEYYGVDQLVLEAVRSREPGPPPVPVDVDASELGDGGALAEAYDSLLVRVSGASVVETNPDAPSDYDETKLTGELRLDDLLLPELDNEFTPGTDLGALVGIAGLSFDHRKVWPRTPADLEP